MRRCSIGVSKVLEAPGPGSTIESDAAEVCWKNDSETVTV